ncbi:MAG: DUF4440 domain-containing protein [Candidatus Zixiibacteriota bacterium]
MQQMKPDNPIHQLLYSLEQRLLQPDIRRSSEELNKLLADDFIEFGASGTICDKRRIIEELAQEPPVDISITDFAVCQLAPDIVLATYHAVVISVKDGQPKHSLRSSIWKLADGSWRMLFHQGTPTAMPSHS